MSKEPDHQDYEIAYTSQRIGALMGVVAVEAAQVMGVDEFVILARASFESAGRVFMSSASLAMENRLKDEAESKGENE